MAREICAASCLPRKELLESWAVARKVLRRHRGGPVLDLAGGHGLVAWLMLLQDRSTPAATVVDRRIPKSAVRLKEALSRRWPEVTSRLAHVEGELDAVRPGPDHRLLGVHACGGLTDRVLDLAVEHRCRVAVLPCCHSTAKLDDGGLAGWMPVDVAIDATRAARLRHAGFVVHTTTIDDSITPKNRLLLASPEPPMRVVPLGPDHESALADFLADFEAAGERSIPAWFLPASMPHTTKVARLDEQSRGVNLTDGHVPGTTRFLEHEGRLLGVSNFRHRLTPSLERFGGHVGYSVRPSARGRGHATRLLEAAKDHGRTLGIDALVLTCAPTNVASARVITKCGGVLVDQYHWEPEEREVCRFRIPLERSE
ncbi:MAG: GNAT family N-acetyltransferase [Myxococcota bacterium]